MGITNSSSSIFILVVHVLWCAHYSNSHGHWPSSHTGSCRIIISYITAAFVAVFSLWKGKGGRGNTSQFSSFFLASELGHIKLDWTHFPLMSLVAIMLWSWGQRFNPFRSPLALSPCMATNFPVLYSHAMNESRVLEGQGDSVPFQTWLYNIFWRGAIVRFYHRCHL